MRLFDILKLSMRMFKARTMRTLLTILGMSVGIAAIIFLVSLGYGLQRTLLQKITTSDALVTLDVTLGES
jgi:ABC-type antimicrobial peptide transport system permease subunit